MMSCSKKCNVNVSHTVHTARHLFHFPRRKKKKKKKFKTTVHQVVYVNWNWVNYETGLLPNQCVRESLYHVY